MRWQGRFVVEFVVLVVSLALVHVVERVFAA
jgi:hypothetical protein